MAEDFTKAVEDGLKLSKRIYLGRDRAVAPPRTLISMDRSSPDAHVPTALMVYAVITNPGIVDNPDIPSYQPYVHGKCDPPVLIPLQMNGIDLDVDCCLDTAFVRVSGSWRVHCVMGSRSCDCRIAIPMGEQGSILGIEVEAHRKTYSTQLIGMEENKGYQNDALAEDDGFLKPHIFTLTIPQIDGGTNISIRVSWSQKLIFRDNQFSVSVPYNFPDYVTPAAKKIVKKEKIQLNVNSCTGTEIFCRASSHPLKEKRRRVGKLGFLYESEVLTWSKTDFYFSFAISSSLTFGGVLLHSPASHETDQREMFGIFIIPGTNQSTKIFRKDVIFVIDISESMHGKPLEDTKNAVSASLSNLNAEDLFNIIAFSDKTFLFSTTMELATNDAVERAIEWISINFVASGGTNIFYPLDQAIEMLSNTDGRIPMVFLVTDGAVEDERQICDKMKSRLSNGGLMSPRIYTFGIGIFCNHYFLRTLAMISRGQHEATYDLDTIELQMQLFFDRALCTMLANITIDTLDNHDEFAVYPHRIQDLSSSSPLIICGRYKGKFPDNLKATGYLGNSSTFVIDLKAHDEDINLDRVLARRLIDALTAQAWFAEDKQLEQKVSKLSIQTGFVSEFTNLVMLENIAEINTNDSAGAKKVPKKKVKQKMGGSEGPTAIPLHSLCVGFGNIRATTENLRPGFGEPKFPDAAEMFVKAASNCCGMLCRHCCCMCCIETCSKINNQCAIVLSQLCTALTCFGCLECCCGDDGQ